MLLFVKIIEEVSSFRYAETSSGLKPCPCIHPQAQALVPDELHNPDSIINGLILLGAPIELVLLNKHPLAFLSFLCYTEYTAIYSVRRKGKQMKRTNFYLTEKQVERLHQRAEKEGLAVSELIRRAIDAFLAWDDPTYTPVPTPRKPRNGFHPQLERRGLSADGKM